MNTNFLQRSALVLLLAAAALWSTSCAGPEKKASKDKDYDEVYETGSRLPKRVPKKHEDNAANASQVQSVDPEALRNIQDREKFVPPAGTGGK